MDLPLGHLFEDEHGGGVSDGGPGGVEEIDGDGEGGGSEILDGLATQDYAVSLVADFDVADFEGALEGGDVRFGGLRDLVERGGRHVVGGSAAEAGGRFTFDIIAEDGSAPAAATSLTIDAGTVIMPYDSGTFAFNAQTYSLNSFSVTIDNGIDRRYKLGAIKTKKPQPVNQRSVTLRIVLDVDDAFQTAQLAGTQGDATITFTSGSEIAAWTVQNAWLQSTDSPRNGHGIVELTVVMMAEDDDTDAGLELIVTNAQANYYD